MYHKLISIVLLALLFNGCDKTIVNEYHKMENNYWLYSEPFSATFEIQDTSIRYNIYFTIKHSNDYPKENIYIRITDDFSGSTNIDTVNIDLSDEYGIWKGNGSYQDYEYEALLHKNYKFNNPQKYNIKFEQFTRSDTLGGVNEVGFELRKASINK